MGAALCARDNRARDVSTTWVDREVAGCEFRDARLGKRFRTLLERIGSDIGQSIPFVCQDWANTKAAYRFFANHRVSEADILSGHFQSTRERAAAMDGPVLVLHDTTEFTYQRDRPELIGITKRITNSKRDLAGNPRIYTACGILMHSSLAITTAGLPLGLGAVKFWTRDKFKGTGLSRERSIRRGFPSRRKRASDGWRT